MGRSYQEIPDHLAAWMEAQPIFFVATAPLQADGHVNVSPKGNDTFRVLGPNTVAYIDMNGSGAETIAHTRENGRLTIMFCSFDESPNIVRLYGEGSSVLAGSDEFARLAPSLPPKDGARSIISLRVDEVTTACGYGVPLMATVGERSTMDEWAASKGPDGIAEYQAKKNQVSIDGLPALPLPLP